MSRNIGIYIYIYADFSNTTTMAAYHECDIKNIKINKEYPGMIQFRTNNPSALELFFMLKTVEDFTEQDNQIELKVKKYAHLKKSFSANMDPFEYDKLLKDLVKLNVNYLKNNEYDDKYSHRFIKIKFTMEIRIFKSIRRIGIRILKYHITDKDLSLLKDSVDFVDFVAD